MSTKTTQYTKKRRLQAHYGFISVPFRKAVRASRMFDSSSQRDLIHGLRLWQEVGGLALVVGATGTGKSIAIRRFLLDLEETRFRIFRFSHVPTTANGFLRALNRLLGLPARGHLSDLFDQARYFLNTYAETHGPRPILVLDDAERTPSQTLDIIRRLTQWELDAGDKFSTLIIGTEDLLLALKAPLLEPLRSRFLFVHQLLPFSAEDTKKYVRFHLENAGANSDLISDDAIAEVFLASRGAPRLVNQLLLHALLIGVVKGLSEIDKSFMRQAIAAHPLFQRGDK